MGDIVLVRLAGIISRQKTKKIKNFQLFYNYIYINMLYRLFCSLGYYRKILILQTFFLMIY